VQKIQLQLSAWIVLVGAVTASWYLIDGLLYFVLVSWAEGNGVSGSHPRHSVDTNIRDHWMATSKGIPVLQSHVILTTT